MQAWSAALGQLGVALSLCVIRSAAEARPFAYFTNAATGAITEISTVRTTVAATVPLSIGDLRQDAKLSPDGTRLYVATEFGVSVVDTATGVVIDTIQDTLQMAPCEPGNCYGGALDVTPDGAFLYVTTVTRGRTLAPTP